MTVRRVTLKGISSPFLKGNKARKVVLLHELAQGIYMKGLNQAV